jgi:hypothetical protein
MGDPSTQNKDLPHSPRVSGMDITLPVDDLPCDIEIEKEIRQFDTALKS